MGDAIKVIPKPIPVDAIQYDGENQKEVQEFARSRAYVNEFNQLLITTYDGYELIDKDDWIIKGELGHHTTLTPDEFKDRYEVFYQKPQAIGYINHQAADPYRIPDPLER